MSDIKSLLMSSTSSPEEIAEYRKVLVAFAETLIKNYTKLENELSSLCSTEPPEMETKTVTISMPTTFWNVLNEISKMHQERKDREINFPEHPSFPETKSAQTASENALSNLTALVKTMNEATMSNLLMNALIDFTLKITEAHIKSELVLAIENTDLEKIDYLLKLMAELGISAITEEDEEEEQDEFTDDDGDETEN